MEFPPIEPPDDKDNRKIKLKTAREGAVKQIDVFKYHQLRAAIAVELLRAAALTDAGGSQPPLTNFRAIEQTVPRQMGARWQKLYVAISFWDCWIAEAEFGFPTNILLRRNEWAPLARALAADLNADRDITHPQIVGIADLANTANLIRTRSRP